MTLQSLRKCVQLSTALQRLVVPTSTLVNGSASAGTRLHQPQRQLFFLNWLNTVFNRYSEDRVKEVGPDRACAEWLLRNGAVVQWKGSTDFVEDYNDLPLTGNSKGSYCIKTVDASDSSIMGHGFRHFEGCNHIEHIILNNCKYLDNEALPKLSVLKNSLKNLEVLYCLNLTDTGILSLANLSNLKKLKLEGLPGVKDIDAVEKKLVAALHNCEISYKIA